MPSSTVDGSPDVLKCSASELATFLLEKRFEDDAMGAASFLLECTASLPNAEEISAQLMGGGEGAAVAVAEAEAVAEAVDEDETDGGDDDDDDDDDEALLGEAVPLPGANGSTGGNDQDDDDGATSSAEVSATTPRSKFELTAYERGLVLTNTKGERVSITSESVSHVAVFPKPEDCRARSGSSGRKKGGAAPKRNGSMVLITLKGSDDDGEEVLFRNKALKQVCFQLPQYVAPSPGDGGTRRDVEGEWALLLQSSLRPEGNVIHVTNPAYAKAAKGTNKRGGGSKNPDGSPAFRSDDGDGGTSVTTGGMPFIKCHRGVDDGVIYPLEQGLLFFKPPLFVHRSRLHSISCGRGSSGGGSRYVDLVAVLEGEGDDGGDEGGERMEFSNINREELGVLNDYIHKVLVRAMAKDAADDSEDDDSDAEVIVEEVVAENPDAEEEEEDDDDDTTPGRRKRSRRAASREARAANKAQIASLEAKKATRAPQSGEEQEEDDDDDEEEDAEDYCDDDRDSDSDEDGFADDVGVAIVDESDDEDAQIEEDEDDDKDGGSDEDETESEEEEKGGGASRPKKKAKRSNA